MNELLAESKVMKDSEMEWKRPNGEPIVVRCSGHRVDGKDGGPGYFEVFAEDVTEKRTLERQLRMAQKMEAIGRLSGGIAHDFNNLLGVIIGYSGVLKKSLDKSQPNYEYATEIEKAGQRAASLTRQLLAFSRQQVLTPSVLSLNSLVSDMEKMLPRLLGEDINVSLALEPELGNVKADQSQIEQVIMNLAVNARDAMPSGGDLHIQTANIEMDNAFTRDHPGSKHESRDHRAHLRTVLHHQGSGRGHRPRSCDRIWRGEAKQRIYLGGQRAGQRLDFSDLPPKEPGHRTSFRC